MGSNRHRWVISLDGSMLPDRSLIGGKAWSIARMMSLGLPVPPAFVVTTEACKAFLADGAFPAELEAEISDGIAGLENHTGHRKGTRRRMRRPGFRPRCPSPLLRSFCAYRAQVRCRGFLQGRQRAKLE